MTSHRSVPGLWGAEPPQLCSQKRLVLAWGAPPLPSATLWVWGCLGGSGGLPTVPPAAKALLRFKAGCEGNKGTGGRGTLAHTFVFSLSAASLCRALCPP